MTDKTMYGLITQLLAAPGMRDELIGILLGGTREMPGCTRYLISKDIENADAIWINECWEDKEVHSASLSLPAVQDAMTRGKPLIAGFGQRTETVPVN